MIAENLGEFYFHRYNIETLHFTSFGNESLKLTKLPNLEHAMNLISTWCDSLICYVLD
jgi:hypothetical protein